jgi:Fic family protein
MSSSRKPLRKALPWHWPQLDGPVATLIYGSNRIESAGTSFDVTSELCQAVFGEDDDELPIPIAQKEPLAVFMRDSAEADSDTTLKADIRARREVIDHARALKFLIERILVDKEPWSEALICEAHRILYGGLNDDDHDVTAGEYRTHEVAVAYGRQKRSICLRASAIRPYMARMVRDLNGGIGNPPVPYDPYSFAARYHHQFAMIHPFGDGNGRMTRIIANVLLMKEIGVTAPFGHEDSDKEEYLDIMRRARKIFDREDMEVDFGDQTCHHEFTAWLFQK